MTDKKISELASNGAIGSADLIELVQSSVNVKALLSSVITQSFIVAASDLTTAITAGTSKAYFPMPYAFTVTEVMATLLTAQASGSIFTVDINENGTSILSTKLTIDNTETSSLTASTQPVISDASLAKGGVITIDVDQIGASGALGLIVTVVGYKT